MTPASLMSGIHIRHGRGCVQPPLNSRQVIGGTKWGCSGCDHFFVVWGAPLDAPVLAPQLPVAAAYVCRDHHDQPVNFRGKGCKLCPTRKAKRKASQPSDYEMEIY